MIMLIAIIQTSQTAEVVPMGIRSSAVQIDSKRVYVLSLKLIAYTKSKYFSCNLPNVISYYSLFGCVSLMYNKYYNPNKMSVIVMANYPLQYYYHLYLYAK